MTLIENWPYLAIELVLAVILMILVRYFSSVLSNVDPVEELTSRDNVAFGLSLGGSIIGVMLVLSGAITSQHSDDLGQDLLSIALHSVAGLVLIKLGLITYDKLVLSKLNKLEEIRFKNRSVALVDASASIAIALLINAFLIWTQGIELISFIAVIGGSIVGLLMLLGVTRLREYYYQKNNNGDNFQQALVRDQFSSAMRLSSELISVSIIFGVARKHVLYNPDNLLSSLFELLVFGIVIVVLFFTLVFIVKRIVLQGILCAFEIDRKQRLSIACVESSIYIGIAFFLRSLLLAA